MQSPAAMFIESAKDSLGKVPEWLRESQRKELYAATGNSSEDFNKGYELGLQTARTCIATSPLVLKAGIDPNDIL